MKSLLRSLTICTVICGLALPLMAAPERGAKKKNSKEAAAPAAMFKLPEAIALTEEQKEKFTAINKEYTPKFRALAKKNNDVLTAEQKSARREAMKEAKEAGKKGKALQSEVEAAMKLSDAQKEQVAKIKEETMKLRQEMEGKVVALLTPEQKAQLPKKGKQGKANKKKKAA